MKKVFMLIGIHCIIFSSVSALSIVLFQMDFWYEVVWLVLVIIGVILIVIASFPSFVSKSYHNPAGNQGNKQQKQFSIIKLRNRWNFPTHNSFQHIPLFHNLVKLLRNIKQSPNEKYIESNSSNYTLHNGDTINDQTTKSKQNHKKVNFMIDERVRWAGLILVIAGIIFGISGFFLNSTSPAVTGVVLVIIGLTGLWIPNL